MGRRRGSRRLTSGTAPRRSDGTRETWVVRDLWIRETDENHFQVRTSMYASTTVLNTLVAAQPGRGALGYLKLVYLVQGWSLAFGRPVVADLPSFLEFGPVHLAAYDAVRSHGPHPIRGPVPAPGFVSAMTVPESDAETVALVRQVVEAYRDLSDVQLSNHCHRKGTPWQAVHDSKEWKRRAGTLMLETEIRDHFLAVLAEDEATRRAAMRRTGAAACVASSLLRTSA